MTADRTPHTLIGAAARSDCCPIQCDYRPEAVAVYLDIVLDMERAGEDPCQKSATPRYGIDGGGTTGDGPTRLWDVQQAVRNLRRTGREVSSVSVAQQLCPWSLEGS